MTTANKRYTPPRPKSWKFVENDQVVEVTKTEEGMYRIGTQFTPRFKTVTTMEEAEKEVVEVSERLKTFADTAAWLDGWMDPPSIDPSDEG